jgi:uncharacterized flavoprotein (TIGR03862 family)
VTKPAQVTVIGAGPAGLMAAEALATRGSGVDLYDSMPSVARKFLLAGKGGLNLTHSEPLPVFLARYGTRTAQLRPMLEAFGPQALRDWAGGLGVETFVGTSGRVFPAQMKAAPLLRAWLHRLRAAGVRVHVRHRWVGWDDEMRLRFETPGGAAVQDTDAAVLALGGASWPQLGSDAAWVPVLAARGVEVAPLRPANCGFCVAWSAHLRARWAGHPVKTVAARVQDRAGGELRQRGELMITEHGVEGGVVYALSAQLRDLLEQAATATLWLDLAPDRTEHELVHGLSRTAARESWASRLRKGAGIHGVKAALLREALPSGALCDIRQVAAAVKSLPLALRATRPIEEAISTAGGVRFEALDERLMLKAVPGVFCAGEMLDWEARTGGYLLTACMSSGRRAAQGVLAWLAARALSRSADS